MPSDNAGLQGQLLLSNTQNPKALEIRAFSQPPNNKQVFSRQKTPPRNSPILQQLENPVVKINYYKDLRDSEHWLKKNLVKYSLEKEEAEAQRKKE